ncbi:MAG: hypothetical protein WDA72_01310 [Desulfomonilia bacterium]
MTNLTLKITQQTQDFYRDRFGSARRGAAYVLEALPHLVEETRREIESVLSPQMTKEILARLQKSEVIFPFTGEMAAEMAPSGYRELVESLPQFSRVLLEILGGPVAERIPSYQDARKAFGVVIGKNAQCLLEALFPSANLGALYILEEFPGWYRQALRGCPRALQNWLKKALSHMRLESPLLAGHIYMRYCAIGSSSRPTAECVLPVFSAASLEISAMSGEKKVIMASPKCVPAVYHGLQEIFETATAGAAFAMGSFTRLYRCTLAEEVLPRFTASELDVMERLLSASGCELSPFTCGDLLPRILRLNLDLDIEPLRDLPSKVEALSPFGRMALELWLQKGRPAHV